jgi:uncharacterized repeat protein (TIGR04076 family)
VWGRPYTISRNFQGGFEMSKCKITVLKRTLHQDLMDEYLKEAMPLCERFQDGQEFIVEGPFASPEDFCAWAWADIRKEVFAVALGGNLHWTKRSDVAIVCCTDGYRPVIFKVERVD